MRTAAINTTARNARCSIVTMSAAPGPVGGHSPQDERDGTYRDVERPAIGRAPARARAGPVVRTPSTKVQNGTPAVARGRRAAGNPRSGPRRCRTDSSSRAAARNRGQRVSQLCGERSERLRQRCGASYDDHGSLWRRGIPARAIGLAKPAAGTVALHGVLELSAHGEPCAHRLCRLAPQYDQGGSVDASALLEKRLEFGAAGQPLASGEATR
jgi:hypothetical protein